MTSLTTTFFFFNWQGKITSPPVTTQNPEYIQTEGVKIKWKEKKNYGITIYYVADYEIKEYSLRNIKVLWINTYFKAHENIYTLQIYS